MKASASLRSMRTMARSMWRSLWHWANSSYSWCKARTRVDPQGAGQYPSFTILSLTLIVAGLCHMIHGGYVECQLVKGARVWSMFLSACFRQFLSTYDVLVFLKKWWTSSPICIASISCSYVRGMKGQTRSKYCNLLSFLNNFVWEIGDWFKFIHVFFLIGVQLQW